MVVSVNVCFLLSATTISVVVAVVPQPEFIWYMYPQWKGQLYGYIPKKNATATAQDIVGRVTTLKEDGIIGAYMEKNTTGVNKVILGTLNDTCIGNITACDTFTVAFLCKARFPLPIGQFVRFLISSPWQQSRPGSHPAMIGIATGNAETTLHAAVGRHTNDLKSDGLRIDSSEMTHWTHVAFVFRGPLHANNSELYVNGSRGPVTRYEIDFRNPSDSQPLLYTIGDDASPSSMAISRFQVIKGTLNETQVRDLKDSMFEQALQADQVVINLTPSTIRVNETAGSVQVLVERTGNVEIASVVRFAVEDGSAVVGEDFTFVNTEAFIFKPGEIHHSIAVSIVTDEYTEDEENFTLSAISLDDVTSTPDQVTITISSHTGPLGRRSPQVSQITGGEDDEDYCKFLLILLAVAIGLATLGIVFVIGFLILFFCC